MNFFPVAIQYADSKKKWLTVLPHCKPWFHSYMEKSKDCPIFFSSSVCA